MMSYLIYRNFEKLIFGEIYIFVKIWWYFTRFPPIQADFEISVLQQPQIPDAFHRITENSENSPSQFQIPNWHHQNNRPQTYDPNTQISNTSSTSINAVNPEHMNRLRELLTRIADLQLFDETDFDDI